MTTVSIHMPELTQGTLGQDSGYSLLLSKTSDRSALNGSGDALVWAGNKWLTADVGETWTETLAASVLDSNSLAVRDGWLAVGETTVTDCYPAGQSVVIDGVGYLLAQEAGAVSDAQTSAPVYSTSFNGSTYTVTHTGVTSTGVRGTATRAKT